MQLHLVDVSGFIYRAYYGMPALNRSDGLPVGAVYGYAQMLDRLINFNRTPDVKILAVFDAGRRNWRHTLYPEYKSNRPPAPEFLQPQFPLFRTCSQAYGLPCIEAEGYEADDIIATYARAAHEAGIPTTIHSSDKDLMQLVRHGSVGIFDPMKKIEVTTTGVMEKWGVPPTLVTHVQALAGDTVDKIPGVHGIGTKKAADLINRFGSLEAVLANAASIKQPAMREALLREAEMARLSYKLVCLDDLVPGLPAIADIPALAEPGQELIDFLTEYEFTSLMPPPDRVLEG